LLELKVAGQQCDCKLKQLATPRVQPVLPLSHLALTRQSVSATAHLQGGVLLPCRSRATLFSCKDLSIGSKVFRESSVQHCLRFLAFKPASQWAPFVPVQAFAAHCKSFLYLQPLAQRAAERRRPAPVKTFLLFTRALWP
jgi:hypothetical protein